VQKLNNATSQAIDTPAIKSRLHELGVTGVAPERRSPEYLARFVVDEIARWAGPIKANGLQVDLDRTPCSSNEAGHHQGA
jgi:hypothetical protein